MFRLPCSCIFSCSSNCYSYLRKCVHTMTKLSSLNSVCKIQQFFHLRMCVKYGILKKQILTILEKQSMVVNGRNQNMNVNGMVHLFDRTIKNILRNLIPHEAIICDDRDPPWINSSIRRLIHDKNEIYTRFKRSNNNNQ